MLNHAHQLQERRHHTKRDGAVAQSDTAPHKGQQVAQAEDATHDDARDDRKVQAPHDVAAQTLLHGVEPVGDPLLGTQRAQHGIILHALLHLHLYAALVLTDVQRHLAQLAGSNSSAQASRSSNQRISRNAPLS